MRPVRRWRPLSKFFCGGRVGGAQVDEAERAYAAIAERHGTKAKFREFHTANFERLRQVQRAPHYSAPSDDDGNEARIDWRRWAQVAQTGDRELKVATPNTIHLS